MDFDFEDELNEAIHAVDSTLDSSHPVNNPNYGQVGSGSQLAFKVDTNQKNSTENDDPNKTICLEYAWGYCEKGPACKRKHEFVPDVPAVVPDWFLQSVLDQCTWLPGLSVYLDKKTQGQTASLINGIPPGSFKAFIVKSHSLHNVLVCVRAALWATSAANAARFVKAFHEYENVILIFSANESGGFQGYARMQSLPIPGLHRDLWGAFSNRLSPNFRVEWIKQTAIQFEDVAHLRNPLNDNLPLRKSRDGQEIPADLAVALCKILSDAVDVDLLAGEELAKGALMQSDQRYREKQLQEQQKLVREDANLL